MAMVYGVVRQHEGLIHVDSTPGRGTTVEVYFPVVTPTG
jgi:signal transduction histidine kinase